MSKIGVCFLITPAKARFLGQSGEAGQTALLQFLCIERIGEIEGHALVVIKAVTEFFQKKSSS